MLCEGQQRENVGTMFSIEGAIRDGLVWPGLAQTSEGRRRRLIRVRSVDVNTETAFCRDRAVDAHRSPDARLWRTLEAGGARRRPIRARGVDRPVRRLAGVDFPGGRTRAEQETQGLVRASPGDLVGAVRLWRERACC